MNMNIAIFWFRRDLRLEDNKGLYAALTSGLPVVPLFIFDSDIVDGLSKDDARVTFIHDQLTKLNNELASNNSSVLVKFGKPAEVWKQLMEEHKISAVYTNHDYEPYAISRDQAVANLLGTKGINFHTFKDQVIFERSEVTKDDGLPYTVFTPYRKKWMARLTQADYASHESELCLANFSKQSFKMPALSDLGFERSNINVKPFRLEAMDRYEEHRNFPAKEATSYLSPHLRFGTVSVRGLVRQALATNDTFLGELIWREFFMQILYHFPRVVNESFRKEYDSIQWINDETQFEKWCQGKTGYPLVDAGMRELNQTGYMHNRVRMVVASFLTKHLLIDWRWGEAYFAEKLLDYELSANNGNWQWAAGTGCDAAPYFRVFNPSEQLKKFDPKMTYCRKWLGNDIGKYPPIVDHAFARKRALEVYKAGLAMAR
jgi:deoxyribodipyrimidine photo-lyase